MEAVHAEVLDTVEELSERVDALEQAGSAEDENSDDAEDAEDEEEDDAGAQVAALEVRLASGSTLRD